MALFSRRAVLLQLASIPITLPLARSLRAQTAGAATPKKLVIFMCNNGTKRGNFWPAPPAPGMSVYPLTNTPILNSLFTTDGKTDNGLKAKTNVIRGLNIVAKGISGGGNQHDNGFAQMFTGVQLKPTPDGKPWGGDISLDQILANDWKMPSFTTAVVASQVQPGPKPGFDHRLSFSYVAPQRLKIPFVDPVTAYSQTFPATAGSATAATAAQRLAQRKSVLDCVSGDLQELAGRLGPDDNHKLDFHLSAVRDAENQLSRLMTNHGSCGTSMPPKDFKALPGGAANEVSVETYVPDMIDAFAVMMGAALKCGLTRIASLQFGYGGGKWACGWLKINVNHHDNIAHRDITDTGTDQISQYVTTINQYYASVVQKLALDLNSTPDGSGTLLDSTLVIWANELGRGDHQLTDIPMVFIGLVGNGISKGGRLIDVAAAHGGQQQPHNIFGYHALNALGHTTQGWGEIADMTPYAIPGF
jgi:hypothetical protein